VKLPLIDLLFVEDLPVEDVVGELRTVEHGIKHLPQVGVVGSVLERKRSAVPKDVFELDR
jgi:hypothetical protein